MNEKKAVEILGGIKKIFDKIHIDYWLDTGTLLGAVRDGKFIEWDKDVDLGTWYDAIQQITDAFPEFEKKGFEIVLNVREGNIKIRRTACNVDIYLYRKTGDYAYNIWFAQEKRVANVLYWYMRILSEKEFPKRKGSFFRKRRASRKKLRKLSRFEPFLRLLPSTLKRILANITWIILSIDDWKRPVVIPKHYFENLSTTQFYGMQFGIPSDVEKYLEHRYGRTWKVPIKKWIYYKDDNAINTEVRA